jgi:UDP-2,3-diacylglucosamine pyrophosphatase LpxH
MPIENALIFSDVHLGWVICDRHHARWLERLPEAVDDAELVILNGDIIDAHRRVCRRTERELVEQLEALVAGWRREGRTVVYIEGNHDADLDAAHNGLRPERWCYDFETRHGERVRVLHGHRFAPGEYRAGAYERAGRPILAFENRAYGRHAWLQSSYRFGPRYLVSAIGSLECSLWRRRLPAWLTPLLGDVDVLAHGHIHYGPGQGRIGAVTTWRTGAWVSPGHRGSVDRMLRYRGGRFERIGWSGGRWQASDDGR